MRGVFYVLQLFLFYAGVLSFTKHNFRNRVASIKNMKTDRFYGPFGKKYYEDYLRKLNSRNISIQNDAILNNNLKDNTDEECNEIEQFFENQDEKEFEDIMSSIFKSGNRTENNSNKNDVKMQGNRKKILIITNGNMNIPIPIQNNEDDEEDEGHYYDMHGNLIRTRRNPGGNKPKKTENFEVITKSPITFKDIGGYENIKLELNQCVDILTNYKKYSDYNVRIPKGLILEGPPGNGKTLLAKGFAGETKTAFIPVSGAQFQDKYVGVGSSRVRELFELAKKNTPCIVFIDEIDAVGRKRSNDGETSGNERDSTLNELLIALDGFKTSSGVFLMGATNRADLLDPALIRPGRIDKRIFIGPPDSTTREAIINIHLTGKPYDKSINVKDLVDMTAGLSGAQIENILNEAMLNALRHNRVLMEYRDIDAIIGKMMVGWQPTEHQFSNDIIKRIAIHEMGHAIVGFLSKHHSKVTKVIINLSSPNSPGYTMFETSTSNIYTRESLFEHLMILLAGRIAEESFYDVSVTTGAINDFEEAFKLAEKMIIYYGMGKNIIYPNSSDKYKEIIDSEVIRLINDAYAMARILVNKSKDLIHECADILQRDKLLKIDRLTEIINEKYPEINQLKIEN
uniref:AAA+ ATPase domain-containing protein n=1 Tax=viral metagenome TaxID=1070528 RepID=A0A6C0DX11_9ZZZZ